MFRELLREYWHGSAMQRHMWFAGFLFGLHVGAALVFVIAVGIVTGILR